MTTLAIGASCRLLPDEQIEATGSFEAKRASSVVATDTTARCTVTVREITSRNEKLAATWTWTSASFTPLAALQIDCGLGREYEDGTMLISLPVRESGKPIAIGSYRVVDFGSVPPGVDRFAWITLRTRNTPGHHLAGTSGQIDIQYADSLGVRGTFHVSGPLERNQ